MDRSRRGAGTQTSANARTRGRRQPIVILVVRSDPLEGQTMFTVTCASAALTRAIEKLRSLAGDSENRRRSTRLLPGPHLGRTAGPAMSGAIHNAPDTNALLYLVGLPFGKFPEFCCLCVTVAKLQFCHGEASLTAGFHSESRARGAAGGLPEVNLCHEPEFG